MRSHELAQLLLAEPDVEVLVSEEEGCRTFESVVKTEKYVILNYYESKHVYRNDYIEEIDDAKILSE